MNFGIDNSAHHWMTRTPLGLATKTTASQIHSVGQLQAETVGRAGLLDL